MDDIGCILILHLAQGELLSLIRFKDQPDQLKRCAREALRGAQL